MAEELLANFARQFPGGQRITADLRLACRQPLITVLFGASGSGKTTVLRCLAGLDRPAEGFIRFKNETWFDASTFLPPQARQVGYLSQDYALFPHLDVRRNILYGLRALPEPEQAQRLDHVLHLLELQGHETRLPSEISGGQQQRVALARALVRRARLLLLDEPLSALDAPVRLRLRAQLRQVLKQFGIPAIVVTHDRSEALAIGDELVVMAQGAVVQSGPVQDVLNRPGNLAAAQILGIETVQSARLLAFKEGLASLEAGGARLTALASNLPEGTRDVFVCIRAEDVLLFKAEVPLTSARNRLPSTVRSIVPEPPMLRVELDCGFPLTALLTRQAGEELALAEGDLVTAVVKAPAVHLIARQT